MRSRDVRGICGARWRIVVGRGQGGTQRGVLVSRSGPVGDNRGESRGEGKMPLQRTRRMDRRVILDMKGIEMIWNLRVAMLIQRVCRLGPGLVQAIIAKPSVYIRVVGDQNAV